MTTTFLAASGAAADIADQFGLELPKLIAQVLIFLVVFYVLKTKAYGPILAMLEQRRQRIADGEAKLEKIARDAAEAKANAQALVDKAEADAARVVKEADDAAKSLQERRQQDAVASANTIISKAREAAELEKEQLMSQLKREFGRMVSDATSRVTGKVLTNEDQGRINQETAAQVSA
ncbi:MAG TPA: ATP synthase F0 subunit B [Prosthecobacter sp.]